MTEAVTDPDSAAHRPAPSPFVIPALAASALALACWVRYLREDEGGLLFAGFALALLVLGVAVGRRWVLGVAVAITLAGLGIDDLLPDVRGPRIDVERVLQLLAFPVLVPVAAGMMLRRVFWG